MTIAPSPTLGSVPANGPTEVQHALKSTRGCLFLVFLYSCAYNLLLLTPSIYLLQIYDRVLSSRSIDTLLMLTIIVALAVLTGAVLDFARRASLSRIGSWLEDRLRPSVVAAAFTYARVKNPALAAEAFRDLGALRQFIGSGASTTLFDVPWSVVFFGILFLIDPLLGVIAVGGAVVMLGCAVTNEALTRNPATRAQALDAATSQRLGASLRNVNAIRAMGMLGGVADLLSRDVHAARQAHASAMRRNETLQALSRGTRGVVQVLLMGAAAWLVLRDNLNAGIIFASSLLLGRGLAPIDGMIGSWKSMGSARIAYRRLNEILREDNPTTGPVPAFPLPAPRGALALEAVTFVPPETRTIVLQGVSLRLAPGECLGVIGPSGAGKSSLAKVMSGVMEPTVGRVRLDGADLALWVQAGGTRHLGYLPQEIELFEGTVAENIARLHAADPEAVIAAAMLVGLHDAVLQMPNGYDTQIGEAGMRLSGGQRQLLGLARAFFCAPRLIVLDEPNSNLDEAGEQRLHEAVGQLKAGGATIVVMTHRFGILDVVDRIAILRAGSLVAVGTAEEIYQKHFSSHQAAATRAAAAPGGPPAAVTRSEQIEGNPQQGGSRQWV